MEKRGNVVTNRYIHKMKRVHVDCNIADCNIANRKGEAVGKGGGGRDTEVGKER